MVRKVGEGRGNGARGVSEHMSVLLAKTNIK